MKNTDRALFDFDDYRAYLKHALPVKGKERGARVRLAAFLGCQSGFISQVLTGLAEFSLEHAMKISRFLEHSKEERNFFLLLVHLGRAGSMELKDYYEEQIEGIRSGRRQIRERVQAPRQSLSLEDQLFYYSSWHYTAVHMCLVNPARQTRKAISEYLKVPGETVARVLTGLLAAGLARQEGERFIGRYDRIHITADSPLVGKHHTNWRMRAIQSLDHSRPQDLHYSSVMSISADAAEQIRNLLLSAIQTAEPIIKAAKDEGVYALALDLFEMMG